MEDKGNLIQTIRIFRKTEDDLWVLNIIEFLELIGCMVCDHILKEDAGFVSERVLRDSYDVELIFNLENTGFLENLKNCVRITEVDKGEKIFRAMDQQIRKVIDGIWPLQDYDDINKDLHMIRESYTKYYMFFYLYNKGNLQFVQNHYWIHYLDPQGKKIDHHRGAYFASLRQCAQCYNEIVEYHSELGRDASVYLKYIILNFKYRLNDISNTLGKNFLFRTSALLRECSDFMEGGDVPIRLYYMMGKICRTDGTQKILAEKYYLLAIKRLEEKSPKSELREFLYYACGKYYETTWMEMDKAYEYYEKAYEANSYSYRGLYKIAVKYEVEKKYIEAKEVCQRLIHLLVDGYDEIEMIMPKQMIYIYKAYKLLGDICDILNDKKLALLCYNKAKKIAGTDTDFYRKCMEGLKKEIHDKAKEIAQEAEDFHLKSAEVLKKEIEGQEMASPYLGEFDNFTRIFYDCMPVWPLDNAMDQLKNKFEMKISLS